MLLYRLCKAKYANDLSGDGAKTYGGRWNNKGKAMLYLASNCSLAVLEVLVHLPPLLIPNDYCIISIEVPDDFDTLAVTDLPANWNNTTTAALRPIGDKFLAANQHLMLRVPSSIVPLEYNFLLNPLHPQAHLARVSNVAPYNFDDRLL